MNSSGARVLVIRGGAIGDFILTLPALRLIRESMPGCHLEVLGYPAIAELAVKAGLAEAVRSLEQQTLAPLFAKDAQIDAALAAYLGSFDRVVSYLHDPDGCFSANLERAGVKSLIECSHRVEPGQGHAAAQLARPLERLGMFLEDPAPKVVGGTRQAKACTPTNGRRPDDVMEASPSFGALKEEDRLKPALQPGDDTADRLLRSREANPALQQGVDASRWSAGFSLSQSAAQEGKTADAKPEPVRIAIHPGSGSEMKNWPWEKWVRLVHQMRSAYPNALLCFITGEAEEERGMIAPVREIVAAVAGEHWHARPLALLADDLASCAVFLGHDSGIAHLAAACGARCLLLFGPTDPAIWAPANPGVQVICAPAGDLRQLDDETVHAAVMAMLQQQSMSPDSQPCDRTATC